MSDRNLTAVYAARLRDWIQPRPDWSLLQVSAFNDDTVDFWAAPVAQAITFRLMDAVQLPSGPTYQRRAVDANDALPYPENTFDWVLCLDCVRYADHEYDLLRECVRVLKPGGLLVVGDGLRPEDPRAGAYVDSFMRLRDLHHYRTYTADEWRGLFLDLDLEIIQEEPISQADIRLQDWARETGCSTYVIQRLHIMLAQAPSAVADWLQPQDARTVAAAFSLHHFLIMGCKKDN